MDAIAVAEANTAHDDGRQALRENGEPENRFSKAISAWRSIGLSSLIAQLDTTATEIVNHQKDAVVERKDLAQKTKDFRKLDDADKLTEYKTLLKAYQTFVDLITSHGKESSAAFLQVYTTLSEAPDPFPLLEASVEALVTSEDTLPRLTSENVELRQRVDRLSQELETTEAKYQAEVQARTDAEKGSGRKIEEIEASWRKVLEEKESNWAVKEMTLEEKLENQDRLLKETRANYEVAQRLGKDEQESALQKAASAELKLLTSDLEKTTARLAQMEARNEQLSVELAQAASQTTSMQDDDPRILRLRSENLGLLRRIESSRFEREAERKKAEEHSKHLDRQRRNASDECNELRTKLSKYSDYDEIKRELDMLRSIELSTADDDAGDEQDPTSSNLSQGQKSSLEQLLLARNKKLSNDLTLLRVSHQEMLQQLVELKSDLARTQNDLEDSQKLSATLENDLTQLQEEAASGNLPSSGMSVAGTYVSRYPHSSRRGRSSPTSSIISGFDGSQRIDIRSGEPLGGGSSILPMVQAQRDRFKQKTQQLEDELQKTYTSVTSLRQEVASLQKDNLSLYEKSRYMSTYERNGRAPNTLAAGSSTLDLSSSVEDGDRWKAQYEANISPFAAFRGREATKAYRRMNMVERMVFSLTRIVLATRTSRNLFAAYCAALHLLVILMLYWMSAANTVISHPLQSRTAAVMAAAANAAPDTPDWRQEGLG